MSTWTNKWKWFQNILYLSDLLAGRLLPQTLHDTHRAQIQVPSCTVSVPWVKINCHTSHTIRTMDKNALVKKISEKDMVGSTIFTPATPGPNFLNHSHGSPLLLPVSSALFRMHSETFGRYESRILTNVLLLTFLIFKVPSYWAYSYK